MYGNPVEISIHVRVGPFQNEYSVVGPPGQGYYELSRLKLLVEQVRLFVGIHILLM